MISVFSTETRGVNGTSWLPYIVVVKVDETRAFGGPRVRWIRTTHSFEAMWDKMYTARVQLFTRLGTQRFSELWWKVDEEACIRGVTSRTVVKRTVEMCQQGMLAWPTELKDWRPSGVDVDVANAIQQLQPQNPHKVEAQMQAAKLAYVRRKVKWDLLPYGPATASVLDSGSAMTPSTLKVVYPSSGRYDRNDK